MNPFQKKHQTYPLFLNTSLPDIHILGSSPAIDAEDPSSIYSISETEIDLELRLKNLKVDIGADEYYSGTLSFINPTWQEKNNQFEIFPNPTSKFFSVSYPIIENENSILTITNEYGKELFSKSLIPYTSFTSIKLNNLPIGQYSISIKNKQGIHCKQLIVQ